MFEFQLSKEIKKRKVNLRSRKDIEPQEILLDSLAKKSEKELGFSTPSMGGFPKLEVPLPEKIFQSFLLIFLILILILFGKTFQLQFVEGKKYLKLAEGNRFKLYQIQAERGIIYDKNLKQLVENLPTFDLVCQKANLPKDEFEKKKIFKEISRFINKSSEEVEKKILESENPTVLISENISHQTLILLEVNLDKLPGFEIRRNTIRNYIDGKYFANLIGYTGKINSEELKTSDVYSIFDWVGRDGLEKSYEEILRKNPGKLRVEKDALGNVISQEIISLPQSGNSLVLWLDSDLQKKIEEELSLALERTGAKSGAAVAIDPKTGGVLSLVSLPSFDNNLFRKGTDPNILSNIFNDPKTPLFNRAISGQYLTGSIIKPLIAIAALEEKIISPQKKILDDKGQISISNPYHPDKPWIFQDWKIHGWVDMKKAIAESCNVYFYTIGGGYRDQEGLGPTKIKKYLEMFGWGQKTGIDLPGEETGLIPDPEWKKENFKNKIDQIWYDGDTYNLSIGQGFLKVTPLQVATAFSAIANGGILYQPQVVQKIIDSQKNLVEEKPPKIIRKINIDQKNLEVVKEGMREAVIYGTASLLNNLPVKAAAKTGTAETTKSGYYHNWITVFAPYDDPQIVLTVMIENVKGALGAAVPVAQKVLEWYFTPREVDL